MNIQSTRPSPAMPSIANAESYQKAKKEFINSTEQQQDRFERLEKWDARVTIGTGAAALLGMGYLVSNYAPSLQGYASGFAIVVPAIALGAAVHYAASSLVDNSLRKTDFQETRSKFVETRDQYQQTLLAEINDEGVAAITEPRWNHLKSYEKLDQPIPTRADALLTLEVNNLETLAQSRAGDGWKKALANNQDDPNKLSEELELVSSNEGILKTLVAGHGA